MDNPSDKHADQPPSQRILTVGTFDGVHLGHQKILHQMVELAKENHLIPTVISFEPHPRLFFNPNDTISLLNTTEEKIHLLKQFGVEDVFIIPFEKEFSELSPKAYLKTIIKERYATKILVLGYDHTFGKGRTGNEALARELAPELGLEILKIDAKQFDETTISSTKIRKALQEGDLELANNYLGYNYQFQGKVIEGKQLGRTIGFPTANIERLHPQKALPKRGVYIVKSTIAGTTYWGMMNIGVRPTVSQGKEQTIEVHFLEFDQTIYNQVLTLEVVSFLREEEKFNSIEALQKQLKEDFYDTLQYIKEQEFF